MLTRKHYQMVAQQITTTKADFGKHEHARRALRVLAHKLANEFEADNPRFDRQRFLEACGIVEFEALKGKE